MFYSIISFFFLDSKSNSVRMWTLYSFFAIFSILLLLFTAGMTGLLLFSNSTFVDWIMSVRGVLVKIGLIG